jgi:hypothetical protein
LLLAVVVALSRLTARSQHPAPRPQLLATRSQGDSVVAAIEHYRRDHHHPPAWLAELVPGYLAAIPAPPWGIGAWRYRRWLGDSALPEGDAADSAPGARIPDYTLAVSSGRLSDSIFYYSSRRGRWEMEE